MNIYIGGVAGYSGTIWKTWTNSFHDSLPQPGKSPASNPDGCLRTALS